MRSFIIIIIIWEFEWFTDKKLLQNASCQWLFLRLDSSKVLVIFTAFE